MSTAIDIASFDHIPVGTKERAIRAGEGPGPTGYNTCAIKKTCQRGRSNTFLWLTAADARGTTHNRHEPKHARHDNDDDDATYLTNPLGCSHFIVVSSKLQPAGLVHLATGIELAGLLRTQQTYVLVQERARSMHTGKLFAEPKEAGALALSPLGLPCRPYRTRAAPPPGPTRAPRG